MARGWGDLVVSIVFGLFDMCVWPGVGLTLFFSIVFGMFDMNVWPGAGAS